MLKPLLFRHTYETLLWHLHKHGHRELNERTGTHIRVGQPFSFSLDLSDGRLPVCGIRKTYPKSAAAEVAWFLQGRQDVSFIRRYAPLWDKFVEDDGQTVAGAYGHRWRNHFGRDQLAEAILALAANPSDRRIFVSAWDPGQDGLGRPSKNVPCPVGFTLSITDGRLNSTLMIRSSDVFVGLPYDVMGHALLMQAILGSLNNHRLGLDRAQWPKLSLGTMHVTLAHPHLYEVHGDMVDSSLVALSSDDTILMPDWSVSRIVAAPDAYVAEVFKRYQATEKPEYSCRPEVVA